MKPLAKVLLIGGTSHVGKTTLARRCALRLGWRNLSTDQLARHPGRPWREDGSDLPPDVREHFMSLSTAELLDAVCDHYRSNVMPIAAALVGSHLNNSFDPGLVLEGSALLPNAVAAMDPARVKSIWLTMDDTALRARIYEQSSFFESTAEQQALVNRFCARSVAYSHWLQGEVEAHGLSSMDADSEKLDPAIDALLNSQDQVG